MATVGQQLTAPEVGWRRYDDSDNNISYLNHTKGTGASYWNNSCTMINGGGYARFNFTGDKLRIISYKSSSQSILSLYIDGIYIGDFSAYTSFNLVKVLAFDIQGLENKEHCVELKYDGNKEITLDAIDIDENGILKPYNEKLYKYLIQSKTNVLKTIQNGNIVDLVETTPTEELFQAQGFDNITLINSVALEPESKILAWTDNTTATKLELKYEITPTRIMDNPTNYNLKMYTDNTAATSATLNYNCESYRPVDKANSQFDIVMYKE